VRIFRKEGLDGSQRARSRLISIPLIQILFFLFASGALLSTAWLVCHARDVVLVLRHVFPPLEPGRGKRLTSPRSVCAAITLLGFCLLAEALVAVRAGAWL
jgi:hypothetical protein